MLKLCRDEVKFVVGSISKTLMNAAVLQKELVSLGSGSNLATRLTSLTNTLDIQLKRIESNANLLSGVILVCFFLVYASK